MARIIKCKNPNCSVCNNPINKVEEVMSGINHRLFTNNRSTLTHWFPSGGKEPILIENLSPNHLAAIVDLYESEAVKFIHEYIKSFPKYATEEGKRKSTSVQEFLTKHVKGWRMIKASEATLNFKNPSLYFQLFVMKKYNVGVPVKKSIEVTEEYMNADYKSVVYPTERERTKARINLRLTQIRVQQKEADKARESINELTLQIEKLMTQL